MNLTKFYFDFSFRYFLYGKKDFKYEGARNGDAFIKFMEDPKEENEEPAHAQEQQWKDTPSGVVHLGESDFDDFLKSHSSLLVMFYAPCKLLLHKGYHYYYYYDNLCLYEQYADVR